MEMIKFIDKSAKLRDSQVSRRPPLPRAGPGRPRARDSRRRFPFFRRQQCYALGFCENLELILIRLDESDHPRRKVTDKLTTAEISRETSFPEESPLLADPEKAGQFSVNRPDWAAIDANEAANTRGWSGAYDCTHDFGRQRATARCVSQYWGFLLDGNARGPGRKMDLGDDARESMEGTRLTGRPTVREASSHKLRRFLGFSEPRDCRRKRVYA